MPRKKTFKKTVADLKPVGGKGKLLGDPETEGLYIRMRPSGAKAWTVVARNPDGKQTWAKLGDYEDRPGGLTLTEARESTPMELARLRAGAKRASERASGVLTLEMLAERYWKAKVTGKLLEDDATRRLLQTYVLPFLGEHEVAELGRTVINQHLDLIEHRDLVVDGKRLGGEVVVDRVLSALSSMLSWHQSQVDDYTSPIVRGMARGSPADRARDRILSDEEILALWTATEPGGAYNGLVRFCLLSAQRLGKCSNMQWDDIDSDGVWHIRPAKRLASREKGTAGDLPLSPQALAVVNAQHRFAYSKHVFAGRGSKPFAGISQAKRDLDGRMANVLASGGRNTKLEDWRTHDLRRTARSLMPKAGVEKRYKDLPKIPPHVCEITLGHSQGGLIKIYDRHSYIEEKKAALESLGTIVERIVSGRA